MFPALGVLDRQPAVPSASHSCVRQCVRAPLAQLLGSVYAVWLSPTRCALVVGGGIDSFLGFEYCYVITLASRVFRILLPILPSSLRFLRSALGLR